MDKPVIATLRSIKIQVTAGENYWWCSCGLSENQPFCDGKHQGTKFTPQKYTALEDTLISFCGCKYSQKGALCDGTHRELTQPEAILNKELSLV